MAETPRTASSGTVTAQHRNFGLGKSLPAAPSVGEPEPPAPRFPRKRLLAIARACTGKATEAEWAMVYKSAASKVWPSVIGEAIAAFRASRAEVAALRSSLEEARKERDYWKQEHAALLRIRQREHADRFGEPPPRDEP